MKESFTHYIDSYTSKIIIYLSLLEAYRKNDIFFYTEVYIFLLYSTWLLLYLNIVVGLSYILLILVLHAIAKKFTFKCIRCEKCFPSYMSVMVTEAVDKPPSAGPFCRGCFEHLSKELENINMYNFLSLH